MTLKEKQNVTHHLSKAKLLFELLLWCNACKIYKIDWENSFECLWKTVKEIGRACLKEDGNDYSLENSSIQYLYATKLYLKTIEISKLRIAYQIF